MKKIIFIIIALLLSIPNLSAQVEGKDYKFEFFKNGIKMDSSSTHKFVVYENDICHVKFFDRLKEEVINLKLIEEQELKNPINFGSFGNKIQKSDRNPKDDTLHPKKDTLYSHNFYVAALKPDNLNSYDIIAEGTDDDTLHLYEFYVEVHKLTHIEAGIGPVFSNMEYNNFQLTSIPGDTTGSKTIKNNGTSNQIDFVLGAIIRPWGYDERAGFSIWNTFMYFGLGVNNKQVVFENVYLGIGAGYRGFDILFGIHIAGVKQLLNGYSVDRTYGKNDIDDIDKITTTKTKVNVFGGLLIDLGIFSNVFPKVF